MWAVIFASWNHATQSEPPSTRQRVVAPKNILTKYILSIYNFKTINNNTDSIEDAVKWFVK